MNDEMRQQLLLGAKLHKRFGAQERIFKLNGQKVKNLRYCHKLVRTTAKVFAAEIYENIMHFNANYEVWQKMCPDLTKGMLQQEFVRLMWPRLIDDARATLAKMLGENIAESLKKEIYSALILDGQIRGRNSVKPLIRR